MSKFKIIFILSELLILIYFPFSQDTNKTKTDTTKNPLSFIVSENKHSYLSQFNPDTISRNRILWYPLKSIDDIFNYIPGYYLRNMDAGQVNQLTFNRLDNNNTSVLRNGRPINDLIDGSIDLNLLSRNEIAGIELSGGFGNSIYKYTNNVNIINRQQFQFRPYTEIAFWQDRYENVFIDANFSQNFFKGFNFNFGVTKQSYDGKYTNSDFDKWLGRFNFNIAPSKYLNFFLYMNYSKIQRGLNEGINSGLVDINNKETMFNSTLAVVNNSDAYEIKERFDIDGGLFYNKGISFTKLQLYVSNSFRMYRDEENRPNPNGIHIKINSHWINYGAKLQEILNFKLSKKSNFISRTEFEYDDIIKNNNYIVQHIYPYSNSSRYKLYSLFECAEINSGGFNIGGYVKGFKYDYSDKFYIYSGVKGSYSFMIDSAKQITVTSLFNSLKNYSSTGIKFELGKFKFNADYYFYKYYIYSLNGDISDEYLVKGINAGTAVKLYPLDLEVNYSYTFDNDIFNNTFPLNFGNVCLSYHSIGIKDKLEYKIGINSRFWSNYTSNKFSGQGNGFYFTPGADNVSVPANATLDFFIIGKISRATFGLTFENILDRLIFNTGVYPGIDRGGLFNTWSRFNISWSFCD